MEHSRGELPDGGEPGPPCASPRQDGAPAGPLGVRVAGSGPGDPPARSRSALLRSLARPSPARGSPWEPT